MSRQIDSESPHRVRTLELVRSKLTPRVSASFYFRMRRVLCVFATLFYAVQSGQLRSAFTGKVVDRKGEPLPWLTYPAIDFLSTLDYTGKRVLEFGSGYSTLWWAKRAASVIALEADQRWLESMAADMPPNATVLPLPTDPNDRYHRTVDVDAFLKRHLGDQRFDVIVIDGVDRVGTAKASLPYLADGGFIIADNSDSHYMPDGAMPILDVFREAGMQRVDFYGLGPSILFPQCTSIVFGDKTFAFGGQQNTAWLKPFERRSYGTVEFESGFAPVDEVAPAQSGE